MSGVVIGLVGCASAPKVVLNEAVGPCHRASAQNAGDGFVQVFSARERVPIDHNIETFFWNNDFGRNEFLYGQARTPYTILSQDGTVIKRVRNDRDLNDEQPALVGLSPGHYTVEAQAEKGGGTTVTAVVPLVVESGLTTTVDLEPTYRRTGEGAESGDVVRLGDGRVVGCRAEFGVGQYDPAARLIASGANLSARR